MAINLLTIPLQINSPIFAAEFDASGATSGLVGAAHASLMVGQMLTGSAIAGQVYSVESDDEASALFGRDSQVAQKCRAFRAAYPNGALFALGLADASTGVAATGKIIFAGTATESRELVIYVSGRRIPVAVSKGDTATVVETTALAAFADANLSDFVATEVGDVGTGVDFSANHKGSIGNQIVIGHSQQPNERVPGGITVTVTPMSGGLTDPSYAPAVINAIADEAYATISSGLATPSAIGPLTTLLTQRWGGLSDKDGQLFAASNDSRVNLTAAGNSFNSEQFTFIGFEVSAKMRTPWEISAAVAGANALQTTIDPALHMRGVKLPGFSGPKRGESFTYSSRDTLISDGVSTLVTGPDGTLAIERLVTTYQTNSLGFIDKAYQDLTSKRTLSFLRYSMLARIASKFGRVKLKSDGELIKPGSNVVNPFIIKGEIINLFGEWEDAGLVENTAQFINELVVERDASDPNRVNALVPPDLINNLLTFAARIAFKR